MLFLLTVVACSGAPAESAPGGDAAAKAEVKPVSVALNWYPEPEFGGLYDAKLSGAYTQAGLDVTIVPGGPGTPVIPQVASGRAAFGVSSADEVILSRAGGADIVAIFATYQRDPRCILVHASRQLTGIDQIKSGTLALEEGVPFAEWLFKKYKFEGVSRVPYGGGVTQWMLDPNYAQQAYVTSEPISAKKAGGDPQCFMVADGGYSQYANVIVTSGALLKSDPALVKSFVAATQAGWRAYQADPTRANNQLHELNPTLDADTLRQMWDVQKPLVGGGHAETAGIGAMQAEVWEAVSRQLVDLGMVKTPSPPVSELFTTEFVPVAASASEAH
jgi:NitT/TauT family transport system substrate-binding protein